jgi:hypothetical protein
MLVGRVACRAVSTAVLLIALLVVPAGASAQSPQFDPPVATYPAGTAPANLRIADLNGDGRQDIVFADRIRRVVRIYHGQGNGTLSAAPTSPGMGESPQGLATGDVNGDGRIDLIVGTTTGPGSLVTLINNGSGGWTPTLTPSPGPVPFVIATDVNSDGRIDAAGVCGANVCVFIGRGDGSFDAARILPINASALGAGDLNADGRVDLAAISNTGHRLAVAIGRGDGSFDTAVTYSTSAQPESVAFADLDQNGARDIVVSQLSTEHASLNGVVIFDGHGDGTLGPGRLLATGQAVHRIGVADFNGDGHLDLAAGANEPGALVIAGDGEGGFDSPIGFPTNGGPFESTGDMNGDGRADLATLGGPATVVAILLNSTPATGFGVAQPATWSTLVNTTAEGATIRKTAGCDGCYDAWGLTAEFVDGLRHAAFEFTVSDSAPLRMAGLAGPSFGGTPDALEFALRLQGNYAEVRERGVFRRDIIVRSGDILRISIQDNVVRYLRNGAPFYVSAATPAYPLHGAALLATLGAAVNDAAVYGAANDGGGEGGGGGTVAWTQPTNVTLSEDAIQKSSGCDGCYDASAVSEQVLTDTGAFFEFTADDLEALLVVGLSAAFAGDPEDIDFGIRLQSGYAEVREHGVYRADVRFEPGDRFRISIDGGVVSYALNGEVFYTSADSPAAALNVAILIATLGGSISGVTIGG